MRYFIITFSLSLLFAEDSRVIKFGDLTAKVEINENTKINEGNDGTKWISLDANGLAIMYLSTVSAKIWNGEIINPEDEFKNDVIKETGKNKLPYSIKHSRSFDPKYGGLEITTVKVTPKNYVNNKRIIAIITISVVEKISEGEKLKSLVYADKIIDTISFND